MKVNICDVLMKNNIIQRILDNKSDYTELRIQFDDYVHFINNKNEYLKLYGCSDLLLLIKNAIVKNKYISGIYIDYFYHSHRLFHDLLDLRMFKSINAINREVLQYLNANENIVERLQICLTAFGINDFSQIPKTCKLLKSLEITCNINKFILNPIFETINKTNITELKLIFNSILCKVEMIEQLNAFVLKNKNLKTLHINFEYIDDVFLDAISNNYTLLNFMMNNKCNEKIKNIMDRNMKYTMTILLCMNRRIIPKCVFKSMILVHIM